MEDAPVNEEPILVEAEVYCPVTDAGSEYDAGCSVIILLHDEVAAVRIRSIALLDAKGVQQLDETSSITHVTYHDYDLWIVGCQTFRQTSVRNMNGVASTLPSPHHLSSSKNVSSY